MTARQAGDASEIVDTKRLGVAGIGKIPEAGGEPAGRRSWVSITPLKPWPAVPDRSGGRELRTLAHVSRRGTNNQAIVPTAQPSAGALVRWACRSDNRTRVGRVTLQRMDNVGIVVESLDAAISFFAELGLELEGRATIEGDWAERVTGLRHMRVEIAMMRTPDGHSRLEISRFLTPPAVADHRNAPVNALGYLRIMFAVEDIDDTLARLRPHGAELVGELAQYEDKYRLCYVRGPEGILIGLAEQIG
jgi:catechol 2,3-dioxygenase-like lactoylglutathione lyase family enzyme